jgi:CheY-like chemotaxis protein
MEKPMTRRVLIVDDEPLIALTAVDMVESLGYEAVEAHSGAEALEILGTGHRIDLLITDHAMPGMSGAELVREARLLKPDIAIMVSTGYSQLPEEFEPDILFLSKPYSEIDLSAKIRAALP